MAHQFDYTTNPVEIIVTNIIDPRCATTCDPGNFGVRKVVEYNTIKDCPNVVFEYLFDEAGQFLTNGKSGTDKDFLVAVRLKFKNTDRLVPAYKTFNAKTLKAGEVQDDGTIEFYSMKFNTNNKDEVVFYEKVALAFKGELKVEIDGVDILTLL